MKRGGNMEPEKVDIIAVYRNDIEVTEAEYLERLPDPGMIYNKSNIFLGLLEDIYQSVVSKYLLDKKTFFNDYNMLNEIFYKLYLPLVYKYGYTPSLYMYASFIHTDNTYLTELMRGTYQDGSKVKDETTRTVRKWYQTCKAATITRAIDDNSIGAIFASKAAYGLSDTPTPAIEVKQDNDIVDISFLDSDQGKNGVPVLHPVD